MDFSDALRLIKQGNSVAREGWNGKNMWIALMLPTSLSDMSVPYIYMCTVTKDTVPWLASQTDLLASDWTIVH
jgi:hypothetical protein